MLIETKQPLRYKIKKNEKKKTSVLGQMAHIKAVGVICSKYYMNLDTQHPNASVADYEITCAVHIRNETEAQLLGMSKVHIHSNKCCDCFVICRFPTGFEQILSYVKSMS